MKNNAKAFKSYTLVKKAQGLLFKRKEMGGGLAIEGYRSADAN
jgi:hypothetical protein